MSSTLLTPTRTQSPADWRVIPSTGTLGARVDGIDLGAVSRDGEAFAALRRLLLEHKVLFFRDQPLEPAEHVALGSMLGPLEDHPMVPSDPEHPGLVQIYKDLDSPPERYENSFHSDGSWREEPPMAAILRCRECPSTGGDTIWVDMVRALADLPDAIRTTIADLRARHSIEATFGAVLPQDQRHALAGRYPDAEHPVVRTHPETGEQILYVNSFTTHFVNFHTPQRVQHGTDYTQGAAELMAYLKGRAMVPEYQVRWTWEPDSVAIWDNRSTQHYAVMDYWPAVRRMDRASVCGDRPY